jgi:hypothetical protein
VALCALRDMSANSFRRQRAMGPTPTSSFSGLRDTISVSRPR